jgi:cysteinyl-tRNA synthetase
MINGKKMSKSLSNYVSFDEVLSKYSSEAFRYFYMSAHYRRPLDYTDEAMKSAENSVVRLENTLNLVEESFRKDGSLNFTDRERSLLKNVNEHRTLFEEAMDNDLDTHGALDILHSLSKTINEYVDDTPNKGVLLKASDIYKKLLNVLGLFEKREEIVDEVMENIIEYVIRLRESFREDKNYQLSDKIREELAKAGVEITDTLKGTAWKIKKN